MSQPTTGHAHIHVGWFLLALNHRRTLILLEAVQTVFVVHRICFSFYYGLLLCGEYDLSYLHGRLSPLSTVVILLTPPKPWAGKIGSEKYRNIEETRLNIPLCRPVFFSSSSELPGRGGTAGPVGHPVCGVLRMGSGFLHHVRVIA